MPIAVTPAGTAIPEFSFMEDLPVTRRAVAFARELGDWPAETRWAPTGYRRPGSAGTPRRDGSTAGRLGLTPRKLGRL